MAWHIKTYYPKGEVDIILDDAPVDILNVMKQGISTGSTASGRNTSTGELEVYWFTSSEITGVDGRWDKL